MILYTRGYAFNGQYWIGDGIEDRFNGKGGQYFELWTIMVGLDGSVVEYLISISWDQKKLIKSIKDWIIGKGFPFFCSLVC